MTKQPSRKEGRVQQGTPVIAKSKVLFMSELTKQETQTVEKIFDALFNTGFKPILVNNTLIVFVKAIPVKPK